MDMSKTPAAEAAAHTHTRSLPGEPHNRDLANPGEVWAFVLAALLIAVLATAFLLKGVAGIGIVMVSLVPVIYVALLTITVGR